MKKYKIGMYSCLPDKVTLELYYDTKVFSNYQNFEKDAKILYDFLFDNIATSTLIQLAKIINKNTERLN